MNERKIGINALFLSCFLIWQAIALNQFIRAEKRPPSWDQSVHMEIALDFREAIHAGRYRDIFRPAPKPGMPPFPPLYHLALMSAYDWNPANPAGAALWLNWIYLAVLCLSLCGIASELWLSERSWVAAAIFASVPLVLDLCRTQLIDLSVIAWAAAAYWAYIRSNQFLNWPSSIALGFLYAVGMMHKWSFFSYFFPVYWRALKALGLPETRRQVAVSAAIALAGFFPWYVVQLPSLLPRLIQASSDFGVPVWKKGAFLEYLYQMPSQLGVAVFLFGWVAMLVPSPAPLRRNKRLLAAWFLFSYLFWAIVPNRQMRFLLPGLAGFSLMACLPWRGAVFWVLAMFQFVTAANYAQGWIPAAAFGPDNRIVLFPSTRPSGEEWPIAAILQKAQELNPHDSSFSNLTLVANDQYFNGPTLTWMAKWLGINSIRIRGVNHRLCEFSRFVLLKTGKLGPPEVIGGLPEAAAIIQDPKSWFSRAYLEAGRWPLPDHSEAVLYSLRRLDQPPWTRDLWHFDRYDSGALAAKDLSIALKDWNSKDSTYQEVSVSAKEAELRGFLISRLMVEMQDVEALPLPSPVSRESWGDVRLLKMAALKVKTLEITAQSLSRFLEARIPGLKVEHLAIEGSVKLVGDYKSLPVEAEASVHMDDGGHRLIIQLARAKVGPLAMRMGWLGDLRSIKISLDPNPETPFRIELDGLTLKNGKVSVP